MLHICWWPVGTCGRHTIALTIMCSEWMSIVSSGLTSITSLGLAIQCLLGLASTSSSGLTLCVCFFFHASWCVVSLTLQRFQLPGGIGRTSSKNHMKKVHSILRYVESSWGFIEIKQVSACNTQVCQGINTVGINAWSTLVLRPQFLDI